MKKTLLLIPVLLSVAGCASNRGFVIKFTANSPANENYQRSMDGEIYEKYYTSKGLSVGFPRAFNLIKDEILKIGQKTVRP